MSAVADYYDSIPYVARCIETTNIGYLHALARLFGLAPTALDRARVLELGCAGGMNLAPQAECHPGTQFLGIDISPRQIQDAQTLAAQAGLTNIRFQVGDITRLGDELGRFDLILCHGVLSWVSPFVQSHVIRVCGQVLAPNGLALISYNTYPGWHQVKAVRDLLMFHCGQIADPTEKLQTAIAVLDAVLSTVPETDVGYRAALQSERDQLQGADPGYVMHEHFDADNHPFYIRDVAARAGEAGLSYMADAQLPSMLTGGLNEQAAQILNTAQNLVEQEQYLDFMRNRRFRSSLFCRAETPHRLEVDAETLLGLYVTPHLEKVQGSNPPAWTTPSAGTLAALNPVMESLCRTMAEAKGRTIAAEHLVTQAAAKIGETARTAIRKLLADIGPKLVWSGALLPFSTPSPDVLGVSKHPKALGVARVTAAKSAIVPNARHQNIAVTEAERSILPLCDGTRDAAAIAKSLGGKAKADDVQSCLKSLALKGLLTA